MQLHGLLTAEGSAKMAEEDEEHRLYLPHTAKKLH
jgi:hypothetical protein